MKIRLKRAYDSASSSDGARLLVERLWPRGVKKEELRLEAWLKDVAPSPELRKWFAHDASKWPEFQRRYLAELRENAAAVEELKDWCGRGPVTFVYAARDPEQNSALLLKQWVESGKI